MALQASTQLDAFAHFGHGHVLFNGYWAGLVTGRSGARRLGVHHHGGGIVGRGVLLDAARVGASTRSRVWWTRRCSTPPLATMASRWAPATSSWCARAGWAHGSATPACGRGRRSAGLTIDTVEWLAERDVAMVAADNRTVEAIPGPSHLPTLPFHIAALATWGCSSVSCLDLDELAGDCAADGVYEFLFVAEPLPVVGGAGRRSTRWR